MTANGIGPIDMVVVNLYQFEETIAKGAGFEDAVENIDIGGPTMLRAAAKNYQDVSVVVDPADYAVIAEELKSGGGNISVETNFRLMKKVFATTSRYDVAISNYLNLLPRSKMRTKSMIPSRIHRRSDSRSSRRKSLDTARTRTRWRHSIVKTRYASRASRTWFSTWVRNFHTTTSWTPMRLSSL
jgi:AICAR transformylase/IMP cyclohydrolase PurH